MAQRRLGGIQATIDRLNAHLPRQHLHVQETDIIPLAFKSSYNIRPR